MASDDDRRDASSVVARSARRTPRSRPSPTPRGSCSPSSGYHETSINDIAERANVAPRTFFRYFPTKEAVVYPEFDEMLAPGPRRRSPPGPTDEPVMASLLGALETLTDSMSEETIAQPGPPAPDEGHPGRCHRRVLAQAVDRRGRVSSCSNARPTRPTRELRAKLASGVIGLIMDTSREHWVQTGATEALPDVGQRCMSMMHDLLAIPRPTQP